VRSVAASGRGEAMKIKTNVKGGTIRTTTKDPID
jgi:hypothetical protein